MGGLTYRVLGTFALGLSPYRFVCLPQVEVGSADEALAVLRRGSRQRQRAETGLNYNSSRSHSIFTVRRAQRWLMLAIVLLSKMGMAEKHQL